MTSPGNDTIETAALGRPFQLGMLYDCRKDALIPGITLWDLDQLQKNKSVQQQKNTKFKVETSDSIEQKSSLLEISGSLQLSLLGGLVKVGGSAKYFEDTMKSYRQARVTLQYQTTTKFETLTMSHLARGQVSHPNVFEDDTATHVVTAILYGAGAYFVFDRELSSVNEKKQVEGKANLAFNKLKCLTVDAEASLDMNDEEKMAVDKFTCTFHGDFQLTTNPTSFNDAVSVYRNLPNMLGANGENAVPLRVWLYPLVKLDSSASRLQREISNTLITYCSETIQSLTKTEMRCSDVLKDTAATTFPAVEKKVQDVMQKCHQYKLDFMQKLGCVLPSVRGGGTEECSLLDILKAHEMSPFNSKDLDQWLKNKERESDTLKTFLKQLLSLGAKMDNSMDALLSDLDIRTVVCFSFTSLDQPESFLLKLSNYLKPQGMVEVPLESSGVLDRNTEWLSTDTRQRMRKELTLFKELKSLQHLNRDDTKFIFASKHDESHAGACIFIYEDGCDDSICFVPPSKPVTPNITCVSHDSITVQGFEPDCAAVEYKKKQNQETEWESHPVQKNQEAVTLSGLKPDTEYEIRTTAVGKLGYAVRSDACSAVTAVRPPSQNDKQSAFTSDFYNMMRNQTKLLMQPYANWEEYLTPVPLSIALLGELVFISSNTDFSINKKPPKDGYKYIRYPESFRACLMQVCNSGLWAFNEAHRNIVQIRIHTVPDYMKEAVRILFQEDDKVNQAHLTDQLKNTLVIAGDCLELANATKKKFTDVINIIQELLEACVNSEHFYQSSEEATKRSEKPIKSLHRTRVAYESCVETMERNQKELNEILIAMRNCEVKEIDVTKSPALTPKPPMMNKEESKSEKLSASQKASQNARSSRAQLEKNRETYEKSIEKMKENEKELNEILIAMRNCEVKEIDVTKSPALTPKPPMMNKEESKSEKLSASQKASQNARSSRAQLEKNRETYEKSIEKMKENEKELNEILITMRNCEVKETDFTIKMLVKGMDGMGRVKEQWEKIVRFFQVVSNIVKDFVSKSEKINPLFYNSKLFFKDLLYTQAFQATNIASLVHVISATYTEVSTNHIMDCVSSLEKLMAMDKEKPEFLFEHLQLQNSCDEAQKATLSLVLKNKQEFERKIDARLEKIDKEMLTILPAAALEEVKSIQEAVKSGFTKKEEADYI